MQEVLVNRLGGLSLPRKSVVRLTDRPDMTLDVYRGRKTTIQQQQRFFCCWVYLSKSGGNQFTGHGQGTGFVVVVLLFYIQGKHLRSCRDGQLTWPHFSWAGLDLLSG